MGLFSKLVGAFTGMPTGGGGNHLNTGLTSGMISQGLEQSQPGVMPSIVGDAGAHTGGGLISAISGRQQAPGVAPADATKAPQSSAGLDAMAKSRGFRNYDEMMAFARQKYQQPVDANTSGAGAAGAPATPQQAPQAAQGFVQSLINPFVRLTEMFNHANSGN